MCTDLHFFYRVPSRPLGTPLYIFSLLLGCPYAERTPPWQKTLGVEKAAASNAELGHFARDCTKIPSQTTVSSSSAPGMSPPAFNAENKENISREVAALAYADASELVDELDPSDEVTALDAD